MEPSTKTSGARRSGSADAPLVVRVGRPGDREAVIRLGHAPPVAGILCPSTGRRLLWRLTGTHAVSVVAEAPAGGPILGAVQFVRSRRSRDTWMFGHWRVAGGHRRRRIGRRLLAEGARLLPGARSLYSYVDWGNDASIAAHERCGFEAGRTLFGSAPLRLLATLGPATPALRLGPVRRREWPLLFGLYARAMGDLWLRLFPGRGSRRFLGPRLAGFGAALVAVVRGPLPDERAAGFVLWEGATVTLYADPEVCDAALLARVAIQIMALGGRRESTLELRGLPRALMERPGSITAQILMGMPDLATQWREPADPG